MPGNSQPNILFILTDQQRSDTLHVAGNPIIKTPHLDRLAREGSLFTSAYTPSPVCVAARAALITGRYPHNTGCFDNNDSMPDSLPTMMQVLTDAGYRTHGIGKMHFTPDTQALRGFESRERQEVGLPKRIKDDDYIQFLRANGYEHVYDPYGPLSEMYYIPQPAQMPARLHGTQWVGDRSVDFIHQADPARPFFLFASFFHPHPPFSVPTPWNKLYRAALMPLPKRPDDSAALQTYHNHVQNRVKYRDAGSDNHLLRVMKAYYYACISFIDLQIGRLREALEVTGRLDDTLVIFTSDHGEFLGDYNCFGKRSMLDAAARVPLIARYPARFDTGQVCEVPVSLVDIMPALLAAAGVNIRQYDLDGRDLAEIAARPGEPANHDRTIYSQFQRAELGLHMAVNRRWKYVYSAPDRQEFLFDRVHDPAELRSRVGVPLCRAALVELRTSLFAYYCEQGFCQPLDGEQWKLYPQPALPSDPDTGLGFNEPAWSRPYQFIPGYSD